MRNDTARYNLMEIIPDKLWSGNFEEFTGTINTYLIEFSEQDGNSSGRVWNKTTVKDCMKIVIDRIVYNSDNQAYAIYHWEEDPDCDEGGGGGSSSSGGGNYYWLPSWGSKDPSNFSDGGLAGSGGSLSGSGSRADSRRPKYEEVPIALEELFAIQLSSVLEEDPFALIDIDCDQIEYWQDLAQHTPSQGVIDKLKNLDDNYTSIIAGDWDVQFREDASGPVVNMDYFPVTITQLPNNPSTGQTFTPEGFFNHIRTNLNDFFEDNSTEFGPYNTREAAIWNSRNYLGAIMRFDINVLLFDRIPGQQDGSVICTNQDGTSWTFTTIESPIDWNHPVSGNRKFGLEDNGDGSFTFYTRGVDRIAEKFDNFIGKLPDTQSAFEGGDALWTKLQENLENYINNPINGGMAQKHTPTINRVYWDDVKDVLNGERPISDLRCK